MNYSMKHEEWLEQRCADCGKTRREHIWTSCCPVDVEWGEPARAFKEARIERVASAIRTELSSQRRDDPDFIALAIVAGEAASAADINDADVFAELLSGELWD